VHETNFDSHVILKVEIATQFDVLTCVFYPKYFRYSFTRN